MTNNKISFLSASFLTISSMLGAGIFLKTKTLNSLSHNNTWAILILMFLGLVIVVSMLMSLSVIISGQTGNMGILEWTQKHCTRWFNSLSVNYMRAVYQPVSLVLVPVYIVELMADGYGLNITQIIFSSIAFMVVFMIINKISFPFAEKLQMCLLTIVLMALFVLPIIGFYDWMQGNAVSEGTSNNNAKSLDAIGPWMILISGFPSIFFMYDGFYSTLSLRSKLKKPETLMKCLVVGFLLITALYSYIIFSFKLVSTTGSFADIPSIKNNIVLNSLCRFALTCAGLLTLNSICMINTKMLHAAHEEYSFKDVSYIKRKLSISKFIKNKNSNEQFTIWIYLIFKALLWYLLIGFLSQITEWTNPNSGSGSIFGINESIADVSSTIIFLIISTVIINFTRKIKENKGARSTPGPKKDMSLYIYSSYIASGIIYVSCIYIYLNYFCGVFGYNGADPFLSSFKLIVTLLFIFISAFPMLKRKYSSTVHKSWHNALSIGKHPTHALAEKPTKIIKLTSSIKSSI